MKEEMIKILAVDDTEFFRVLIKKTLETEGFEVALASNGTEALQLVQSFQPKLLITDIIMPESDGVELINSIKHYAFNLKIIAISGGGRLGAEFYIKSVENLGVDATLYKPFSPNELIETVNKVLAL